jgi:hypothetical protein
MNESTTLGLYHNDVLKFELTEDGTLKASNVEASESIISLNTLAAPSIAGQEIAASLRIGTNELLIGDTVVTSDPDDSSNLSTQSVVN